jgi:hypothetical protein
VEKGGKRGYVENGRFLPCNEEENAVHMILKCNEADETQTWREQFVGVR